MSLRSLIVVWATDILWFIVWRRHLLHSFVHSLSLWAKCYCCVGHLCIWNEDVKGSSIQASDWTVCWRPLGVFELLVLPGAAGCVWLMTLSSGSQPSTLLNCLWLNLKQLWEQLWPLTPQCGNHVPTGSNLRVWILLNWTWDGKLTESDTVSVSC